MEALWQGSEHTFASIGCLKEFENTLHGTVKFASDSCHVFWSMFTHLNYLGILMVRLVYQDGEWISSNENSTLLDISRL